MKLGSLRTEHGLDRAGGWGGWNILAAGSLGLLIVVLVGVQVANRLGPTVPAYVQSFLLSEIPSGPAPYFSISNSAGQSESNDTESSGPTTSEDGALSGTDGQDGARQLSSQLRSSATPGNEVILAGGQRLLAIDYDLNAGGPRAGDIRVAKPVSLNGSRVGTVSISIDQNSQLHLSSADLRQVLPAELHSRIRSEGEFVTFDLLRRSGLNIRYDPVSDSLRIES
ncbi:hypothetical protein [Erythrobacter alti]|uniref:hypothetical protein n=1 Tax=Erythrobacter alti TaxID=1896145 RepID=UPI0030F48E96